MKSMMRKTTLREIKQSFGRYFAILAIVALGVGFFAGLKVTKPDMTATANDYFEKLQLFDYRMLSTLGFREEDVEAANAREDVRSAEGAISIDIAYINKAGNEGVLKVHSITENINGLSIQAGRMPEKADECVVDENLYDEAAIGTKIVFADTNEEEDLENFVYKEYTIVGIARSSYYVNFERGNTSLGTGKVDGFMYIPKDGFDVDYYTEIFVKFEEDFPIYSEEYKAYMDGKEDEWEAFCEELALDRYNEIKSDAEEEFSQAETELADKKAEAEEELADAEQELKDAEAEITDGEEQLKTAKEEIADGWEEYNEAKADFEEQIADAEAELADAREEVDEIEEPDTYVLGRETNVGYACFESDSDIVEGIANVFPIFFFLVAALVCMTTMNRMVEEQRTQIGVLKALGYGEAAIMGKYMFYAGSAALVGCFAGYFGGTWLFPKVIWTAYGMLYSMQDLIFVFNGKMLAISVAAALFCSIGVTWFTCRYELSLAAAELMRPKAPKAGKRVFMEYLPFIWKRLKFLQKVSIRNIVRYKKRFFMMVVGISGCTALLVTGFGIKDSVADIATKQYEEIQIYDMDVGFGNPQNIEESEFTKKALDLGASYELLCEKSLDYVASDGVKAVNMIIPKEEENIGAFIDLHTKNGEAIPYPKAGEIVVTTNLAEDYDLAVGDKIVLRDENLKELNVTISGIAENFVYNYVYLNKETYETQLGEAPQYKNAVINLPEEQDAHMASAAFMKLEDVTSVTVSVDIEERFSSMMASLDYVVLLVISCAAFLAFIVLYNLTNINITERIREIATIKVLGFYRKETASYVFRENIVLTAIGGVVGLGLGFLLHKFVMSQINIDMVSFAEQIKPTSYIYSILLTFVFAMIVNGVMSMKLERINMAESLKSVD